MNIQDFRQLPILGILRGITEVDIEPLTESVIRSGLKTIEIAMNTPKATDLIAKMVQLAQGRLTVGAGTVLTTDQLQSAVDAGATFIVSPTVVDDVVGHCAKNNIAVFPGALTPTEIYRAWESGATMVKVFPAKLFGPDYFKEIKGPFDKIELLACGGVNPQNIESFFTAGASGVAFGASIFRREWIEEKKFSLIEDNIKSLIGSYHNSVENVAE